MNLALLWNNAAPATAGAPREQAAPSTPSSAASDLAWQRAMEQAQQAGMVDWFKPVASSPSTEVHSANSKEQSAAAAAVHAGADSTAVVKAVAVVARPAMQAPIAPAQSVGVPIAPVEAATFFAGADRAAKGQRAGDVQADSSEPLAPQPASLVLPAVGASKISDLAVAEDSALIAQEDVSGAPHSQAAQVPPGVDEAALQPDSATSGTPAPEAVRVYAEWRAEGVHIWIGADQNRLKAVEVLPQQLRQWLSGQGEQLGGLVVNGRNVLRIDPGGSRE